MKETGPFRVLLVKVPCGTAEVPDGGTLAVSGSEVSLWDTRTGEKRGSLGEDAANARYGLAFSPDGRTLATDWYDPESQEARICLWDAAPRYQVHG